MTAYRPKTRSINVSVYSSAGWITGTFALPPIQGFLDYLNQAKGFLKLTDVTMPDGSRTPFFALLRSAALVIVPDQSDQNLQARIASSATSAHQILCLLEAGVLEGRLEIAGNLRVSDYLAQHTDFIALHDASIRIGGARGESTAGEPIPFVVVFAGGVIGVSEGSAP